MNHGRFPEDETPEGNELVSVPNDSCGLRKRAVNLGGHNGHAKTAYQWAGPIETEVKLSALLDLLNCFVVVVCVVSSPFPCRIDSRISRM